MMLRKVSISFAVLFLLTVAFAGAVEIPDGLKTNIEAGKFQENEYVGLKTLIARSWWNSESDEERTLVGVELDYRQPDHADEPPEKISIAFGVWDSKKKGLITGAMGGTVSSSGPFAFKWDMKDENGRKVPDGIYRVIMNITGEHYGDLLRDGGFPLYITSGGPTLEDEGISSRQAVLEYDCAPEIRFTTKNINAIAVIDCDDEDNEIKRWETVVGPGNHTLKSDLKDEDGNALKPGKYATHITVDNPFGEAREFTVRYTLREPEPLELSVKMDAGKELAVDDKTTIPYTVTVNQNAYVTIQHLSDGGAKHFIWKSAGDNPEFLLARGTHEAEWNRRPNPDSTSHYNKGAHWIRVTATSLTGEKKTVETHKVALKAKPREITRAPNITLSLSPDHVVIGGRMQTTIAYSLDMDARVRLALYDSRGGLIKDIVYRNMKKGKYSTDLGVSNLDEGNYKIMLRVQGQHGYREASKLLSIGWRR